MAYLIHEPTESVITKCLGPPQPRKGDKSGLAWWSCPFHPNDRNPSLCVRPGDSHFHCYGCGAHGSSIDFVMRFCNIPTFSEAVKEITGESPRRHPHRQSQVRRTIKRREIPEPPEGWTELMLLIIAMAEQTLWSEKGHAALNYLKTKRGLSDETIRAARLGYWPEAETFNEVFKEGILVPRGIVIPWFDGGQVVRVEVRRPVPDAIANKYHTLKGGRGGSLYQDRTGIITGRPLVIVEGALDALLVQQAVGDKASVRTLGSAGVNPSTQVMGEMSRANPWVISGDSDGAGERAARDWLKRSARSVRVPPPADMGKDWTEAYLNGLDLQSWWDRTLTELSAGRRLSTLHETKPQLVAAAARPPIPLNAHCEPVGSLKLVQIRLADAPAVIAPTTTARQHFGELAHQFQDEGDDHWTAERRAIDVVNNKLDLGKPFEDVASLERSATEASRRANERSDPEGQPWRCQTIGCRRNDRWWLSVNGEVIYCFGCTPPAFPGLIAAEGSVADAPQVEAGRSTTPTSAWMKTFKLKAAHRANHFM